MSDSADFKKKRKNIIGISVVLILLRLYSVPLKDLKVFGVNIPIESSFEINILLFGTFLYLLYRYKNEWRHSEKKHYNTYMLHNLWVPISGEATKKIWLDYKGETSDSEATIGNQLRHALISRKTRFTCKLSIGIYKRDENRAITQNASGQPISEQKVIVSSILSKYVFRSYMKHVMKNMLTGKYSSEYYFPKLLINIVLVLEIYFLYKSLAHWNF